MSFILDALKKSEAERQRQSGPTLLEMRILPPTPRWPPWSVAVGALLLINLGVLGWFLSRRPAPVPAVAVPAVAAALAPPGAAAPAAPAAEVHSPLVSAAPAAPAATAPAAAPTPPGPAPSAELPSAAAAPPVGSAPGNARHAGSVILATTPLDTGDTSAASGAGTSSGSGDDAGTSADTNPADEQPALSRADAVADASGGHVRVAANDDSLPDYSDLAGTIPLLSLDLHVYSDNPADRYALINMHKAREGDVLPDGERVVRISPQGVVMDYRGQRFVLRQQ